MLRARPLAPLAAGFCTGIALALLPGAWPWLAALGALAAVCSIRWRHPALLAILGLGLGALRQHAADATRTFPAHVEPLEGVVQGPPRIYRSLADPRGELEEDGSFVVDGVQVRYFRKHVPLIGGERVRVTGRIAPPKPATNPGQFDYAQYLRRQGIDAVVTMQNLEVLDGPSAPYKARAWFRSLFDRGMRPEVGAFIASITMGGREPIPDDLKTSLQQSGTAHLIAISGQNLVIVMMSFWVVLTLAGLRGRFLTILLIVLLGLYTLLTGLEVSVVRSYFMLATFFGADLEFLGPPVWEKFGRSVPPNETSIVLRAAGVLFPGDIEERGVEELLTVPDVRARVLVMPHHGKYFRQHRDFVRRVAPETILVSAPEGYSSAKVLDELPFPPRTTGREGAIEIPLK